MSSVPPPSDTSVTVDASASGVTGPTPGGPERWVGALHLQDQEDDVLACLVSAALWSVQGANDATLVLWRDPVSGERIGRVGAARAEHPALACARAEASWSERADAAWPAWCGRLRSFRLPLTLTGDPAVQACLDAAARSSDDEPVRLSASWPSRLGVERVHAWPLRAAGSVVGVLAVAGERPAAAVLEELAVHGGLALERIAARRECRSRRSQFATLRESARGLLHGQGLGSALSRLVQTACATLEGSGAALWLVDRGGAEVVVARVYEKDGVEDEGVVEAALASLASDVTWRQRALVLDTVEARRRLPPGAGRFAPLVAAPVAGLERPRGALFVYGREAGRELDTSEREARELLEVYGLLVGLVIECAAEWERAREAERRVQDLKRERQRLRTAADLGETSVRLAQEMATPIASLLGFARRTRRALADGDPHREYLEIVVREGERLERLVEEHLAFASLARSQFAIVNLNRVLQEVLERVAGDVERRQVRLLKRLSPELPHLLLDSEKIESAVENIIRGSLESVPAGGRLLIQTRVSSDQVLLEVCHDGPPLGGAMDELFAPFATGGRPGAGLGLALAQRVLRDHGGEIGVHSRGDWGHVVTLALPVVDNADRRRPGDRRLPSRRDRRGAWTKR